MKNLMILIFLLAFYPAGAQEPATKPWIWQSELPADCPFVKSNQLIGIAFTGKHSDYPGNLADTWHPSWASDDKMYSPCADGMCPRLDGSWDCVKSNDAAKINTCITGNGVMEGNDPLNLKIYGLAPSFENPQPYGAIYPCGSLVYNGVWYYGFNSEGPIEVLVKYGSTTYDFPFLGPFIGFRTSTDYGRSWTPCPHTPEKPIFGENANYAYPVKIGLPFFVDFGKNMEHSPDGKAYLFAYGASIDDPKPRFGNLSWNTGDQVYLLRVIPSLETMNDPSAYEFFGGYKKDGSALWVNKLDDAKPLLEWNNTMGPTLVTYNAPLRKYLMCVTNAESPNGYFNTYIMESDNLTGPWKMVTFMKHFGEQAYEAQFVSKFISSDGRTAWLCYSANYASFNGCKPKSNPPGSHYGVVFQEIKLLDKKMYNEYKDNPRPETK